MFLEKFKLNSQQDNQFETYFNELISYNEKVNLTAITNKEEVYIKHFYDSLLGANLIPTNAMVADIGTGAGFPGLPIKIFRKDIKLFLVDSLNKRIEFLKYITQKLEVEANCIHSRAEDFATLNKEKFDVIVSRAVASLNTLCEYVLPALKIGGIFIAYKGNNVDEELKEANRAIKVLGGELNNIQKFELPLNVGLRNIIIIKKVKKTPNIYPRHQNLPKTKPIV